MKSPQKLNPIDKRFQILLTAEEMDLLKKEAKRRNVSSGELLRMSLRNEILKKSNQDRIAALDSLSRILENT